MGAKPAPKTQVGAYSPRLANCTKNRSKDRTPSQRFSGPPNRLAELKPSIHSLMDCFLSFIQTDPKRSESIEEINLASNESTAS
jgi:hypothetical protein